VDAFSRFLRDEITAAGLPLDGQPHGLPTTLGRKPFNPGAPVHDTMAALGHARRPRPIDIREVPIERAVAGAGFAMLTLKEQGFQNRISSSSLLQATRPTISNGCERAPGR
jgi:hypothetical protein